MGNLSTETIQTLTTQCCIAGGGPAGMMLGFLLARAGVEVVVLEKHADFLRDFRGDTIHPSTLEIMHELGLLEEFLKRPHQAVQELHGVIGGKEIVIADFSHLPTHCKFIALMPQWDFLNFIAEHASRYPTFHLKMQTAVTGLIEENGQVVGVHTTTPDGPLDVRADLTVGADGRASTVRECAGMKVNDIGAPMDVLWMRLSRRPDDPEDPAGRFDHGRIMVLIYRGDYWQCGYVIPKGGYDTIRSRGLPQLRDDIITLAPFLKDRVDELQSWDDIKLLTVKVDRLEVWDRPGLLCIGDAAHAMSPVGGVGINLAIQDAVATANLLAIPLREGKLSPEEVKQVQRRREFPMRVTQKLQLIVQKNVIGRVLESEESPSPPLIVRLLGRFSRLRRIPARLIGLGIRPEHVHSPDVLANKS